MRFLGTRWSPRRAKSAMLRTRPYSPRMADPLARARRWLAEAARRRRAGAGAAALATASPDGRPSVRFVLVRGIDDRGLRFFTNYGSRKGRELDANPVAALALWWPALQRQLRAEGPVERLPAGGVRRLLRLARARLAARRVGVAPGLGDPRARGARRRAAELDGEYGEEVPRPDYWGGFLLRPARSSSGRAAPTASTTASTSCATPTAVGAASGSARSAAGARTAAEDRDDGGEDGEAPAEHADGREHGADHGDQTGRAAHLHETVGALLALLGVTAASRRVLEPAHASAFEPAAILRRSSALSSVSSSTPCSRATSRSVRPLADAALTISAALS